MATEQGTSRYIFPERFALMTTRIGDGEEIESAQDYLANHHFALAADFAGTGLRGSDIEDAVNGGQIKAAPWPLNLRETDFFWGLSDESTEKLDTLAQQAVAACYGQTPEEPFGGNIMTVGGEMGSQQLALAGLVYARERGDLREIEPTEETGGTAMNCLYIVRDSYAGRTFAQILPEDPAQ